MIKLLIIFLSLGLLQAHDFQDDARLLGDGVILSSGTRKILISPRLQGTVLVSSLDGESLGWINRDALRNGKGGIGGADRFWFAPDGSQFTVFFKPGVPLEEKNWRVAPEIERGTMNIVDQSNQKITMERNIKLPNHLGTLFSTKLRRTISLLPNSPTPSDIKQVGFRVENTVTNLGTAWKADSGLLSIWSLGSFTGSETTAVHLPLPQNAGIRRYFEPFQPDQLIVADSIARFRCNGNWRSKIGLSPKNSLGVMLSLDPKRQLLTVIRYPQSKGTRFPHAMRGPQKRPYDGDLANVYNHGTLDRSPLPSAMFYEMESSSEMRELKTGESIIHWQEVRHFRGAVKALETLARQLLNHVQ